MNLVITLTSAGTDTGPFNIYSDVDGYLSAFDTNIDRATLLAGFATSNVPDGTVEIRVKSVNDLCNNYGRAGTVPLEYYFEPRASVYQTFFLDKNSYAYVYGSISGYYNGSSLVPGNIVAKINADLTYDTSFNILEGFNAHTVYTNTNLFEQPDGKIIVTGYFSSFNGVSANRIIRLNTDGTRDYTFNIGTGFSDYALGVVQDNSGRFIITGRFATYNGASSPRLIRLLADGSKDTSFNVGSGFSNTSIGVLIEPDDSLIVTSYVSSFNGVSTPLSICKLNADATLNTTFNTNAGTGFDAGNNRPIALRRVPGETGFYAAGNFTTYNGVAAGGIIKINADGTRDATWNVGNPGFLPARTVQQIHTIWDGKILLMGAFESYNSETSFYAIILNADGSTFLTFPTIGYGMFYTIGNNLYGQDYVTQKNELIYTYFP